MINETKNKIVAKLRFPEFRDSSEWTVTTLNEISSLITKGTTPTTVGFQFAESGFNFIKIESITKEGKIDLSKVMFITKECDEALRRSRLKENDILFSIAGALGVVALVRKEILPANTNQALSIIRTKPGYSHKYVIEFLKSPFIESEISKIKAGAAQPNISLNQVGAFSIFLPEVKEQQKIADCLSSLDELITSQIQKLQALKTHKKGLMQQLFPAEGETVPKLRFAEFRDSGEWEEKSLGQVAEIITGKTPSTLESSNYVGDRMFVAPTDISGGRYVYRTKTTLSEKGYSQTRHVKKNSVLFVCIGSTIGKIAQNKHECATNQQINSLVANAGYSSDFIYSTLENNASKIATIAGIQAVPIINKSVFASVKIGFPSPEEQQKIAECLSSLDEQISAQAEIIKVLKAHKKGLMQGLFPSEL